MKIKTLKEFQDYLENEYKINQQGHHFDSELNSIRNNYKTLKSKDFCTWEQWFLDFVLIEGLVKPKLTYPDKDGNVFEYPSFKTFTKSIFDYLENRAGKVENYHLKARYNHLLFSSGERKYRHHDYIKNTIDSYILILQDKEIPNFENILNVALQNALGLSYQIDYKVIELEEIIKEIIIENKFAPWFYRNLSEVLLKFKPSRSSSISEIFNLLIQKFDGIIEKFKIENVHNAIDFINSKIKISNRIGIDSKESLIQKGNFWEELASQRNDFVANDFQFEAIKCYSKAGERDLKELATIKYTQYKKRLVLHSVGTEFTDTTINNVINLLEKNSSKIVEKESDFIYNFLSVSNDILFHTDSEKETRKTSFIDFSKPVSFDVNNNINAKSTKSFSLSISSEIMHFFSKLYIRLIFQKGILAGKINYESLIDFIKRNSWFGQQLPAKDLDGNDYSYNWIGLLAPSFLDFFFQFPYSLRNKYHHTNYILCIDSLTIKFEGVLRDIAFFNNVQTDTYDERNDRMRERYIEEILSDKKIIELLGVNDIKFLKYIFTQEGINLRNNIAHCYLNFDNYSADKFLLLLTAFLRLSKFKIGTKND